MSLLTLPLRYNLCFNQRYYILPVEKQIKKQIKQNVEKYVEKQNVEKSIDLFPTQKHFDNTQCSPISNYEKCYYCGKNNKNCNKNPVYYYWPQINKNICIECIKKNKIIL
jgi:transcription antitermination factor NusG